MTNTNNEAKPAAPQVGDAVIYVDPTGQERNALVSAAWGNDPYPSINLVCVSHDVGMQDNYGRQVARFTSCIHARNQSAPGNYWRRPGEARVTPTVPAV